MTSEMKKTSLMPLPSLEYQMYGIKPDIWPPPPEWPIVMDSAGNAISRWGDVEWNFDIWAGKRCRLAFGDGIASPRTILIDRKNAQLLRMVVGWWILHDRTVRSAKTIWAYFSIIKKIFTYCSREGIAASELNQFPKVVARLHTVITPSCRKLVISLLHDLNKNSGQVGFKILSERDIARLGVDIADHNAKQTAYIPPRIWQYQLSRLDECIKDFLEKRKNFEDLFHYCLNGYKNNHLAMESEALIFVKRRRRIRPFLSGTKKKLPAGYLNLGRFADAAVKFGVDEILKKWVGLSKIGRASCLSIKGFGSYFSLINWVCIGYILNFTLMRIDEVIRIKRKCLIVDDDPNFGIIYLIVGNTSKTVQGEGLYWITSKLTQRAIEAMTCISELRKASNLYDDDGLLFQSPTEPWYPKYKSKSMLRNMTPIHYKALLDRYPLLMDKEQLKITESDFAVARLVTPTLGENFMVGRIWNLAWHQLRRTGAVNMQASGYVSSSSLQYQLKHESQAMSLYYAKNYSRLRLEQSARDIYVTEMYEAVGRELQSLASQRYASPHGERRKQEMIRLITEGDFKEAVRLAQHGGVACRPVILGACMNTLPCSYGGVDSVVHCGGGDSEKPCSHVLYDKEKIQQVSRLENLLDERIKKTSINSPLYESLNAQKRSVANYFSTIRILKDK